MILGNPKVSIRLINAGRTVYHSYGDGDVRHAALTVYGRETAAQLVSIDEAEGALRLSGLIGVGDQAKVERARISSSLSTGASCAVRSFPRRWRRRCRGRVMIGMYPMCALSLTLPANSVDINVHPSKLEVRFRDEAMVHERALALITRALDTGRMLNVQRIEEEKKDILPHSTVRVEHPAPPVPAETKPPEGPVPPVECMPVPEKAAPAAPVGVLREDPAPLPRWTPPSAPFTWTEPVKKPAPTPPPVQEILPEVAARPTVPAPQPQKAKAPAALVGGLRIIGVYASTYILAEAGDMLLMIDQHAAHERLLYERFSKALEMGQASQQLLTPITLDLSPAECDALMRNRQLLFEAGYEIEPFGERSVRVTAVPHVLGQADMSLLFMELIDQLERLKSATVEKRRAEVIQASCKHAVKGGNELTPLEITSLVEQMLATDAPSTCPHGRPVYKAFTKNEIERMFKRIV